MESNSIPAGMQLFWWIPVTFQWILVPFQWIPVDSSGIWSFLQECKGHREVLVPEEYHNFADIFSKVKAEKIALHQPYDLKINLEEGTSPPIVPMYPISQLSSKFSITSLMTISEPDLSARVPPPMAL